eukprot:1136153-Amorphochlora_amoeboformis.AAC.2
MARQQLARWSLKVQGFFKSQIWINLVRFVWDRYHETTFVLIVWKEGCIPGIRLVGGGVRTTG